MNTTGTASHCKRNAVSKAITSKIILGKLFFIVKSLNFKAIKGNVETINQLNKIITTYSTHLLVNHGLMSIKLLPKCKINGKDAMNKPAAGIGTPLNPKDWELSRLNLAKR